MKILSGKTALITGAAGGLGRALAVALAAEGMRLFITDINAEGLEQSRTLIEGRGSFCRTMVADVSDPEQVARMCSTAIEQCGAVDCLINNAGVTTIGEIRDHELDDWRWLLGINLWGPIQCVHHILPHMISRRSGHIVNIASVGGLAMVAGNGPYCTSKFGLVGFSEVLRAEVYRHNIKVSIICPGFFNTNLARHARIKNLPGFTREVITKKSHGRNPAIAAHKIVQAIKQERKLKIIGLEGHVIYTIKKYLPPLYYRIGIEMDRRLVKRQ
jgi:NAD(P)-dependent dehydrogenase (short-subunit alcohol dehydrogenase family)